MKHEQYVKPFWVQLALVLLPEQQDFKSCVSSLLGNVVRTLKTFPYYVFKVGWEIGLHREIPRS